jgi:AAA domain-containing protein
MKALQTAQAEDAEERDAIQSESRNGRSGNQSVINASSYMEPGPTFLSVEDPPIQYLVDELLPESTIALLHGDPRTRKSWAALEIAIALATGTPAFGLDRFLVSRRVPVLYCSQEDSKPVVRKRAQALLRGRGFEELPDTITFSIHRGINIDSQLWQETLLRDVSRRGFRLLVFDPIRRFSVNADKGPAEVLAVTTFLRQLVIETGASIALTHHDTKPPSNGADARKRSHKASGGDWFASSECPIAFENAGDACSVVYPESYKLSADPAPFTFRLQTDHHQQPTVAQLIGETTTAQEVTDIGAQEKVLNYLSGHKGASGSAIAKGAHINKQSTLIALKQLEESGKVDCSKTGMNGRATTWFLTGN